MLLAKSLDKNVFTEWVKAQPLYTLKDGRGFVRYPVNTRHVNGRPLKDAAPSTQKFQNKRAIT